MRIPIGGAIVHPVQLVTGVKSVRIIPKSNRSLDIKCSVNRSMVCSCIV